MKISSYLGESGSSLVLQAALLLYGPAGSNNWSARGMSGPLVATAHNVEYETATNQRPTIMPGQLLDASVFEAVLAQLQNHTTVRQILPPNLLYSDANLLLWWAPACCRAIYFSTADKAFNRDVDKKKVYHPPLLFMATPNLLYVRALATNTRPSAETPVFVAPYCNLYGEGHMCRGDVKLPGSIAPNTMPEWENIFYDSRFTHSNLHGGKMTLHPRGHNGLWREMVRPTEATKILNHRGFDAKYLAPVMVADTERQQTVADLLTN